MNKLLLFTSIIGGIVGAAALPFQYVFHNMAPPDLSWFLKVPFLIVCFGIIAAGSVTILLTLIAGIIELFDKSQYWPNN